MSVPLLGIIELANQPLQFPGCVGNAGSYPYPVIYETAKDAYVSRIVAADSGLCDAYCEAALRLTARGAAAIVSSCGFTVIYQQAVAMKVSLPVLMSPLSLLPLLLYTTPERMKVAVLTYDGQQLDQRFLSAAAVREQQLERIIVRGIENSQSWRALAAPRPQVELGQLRGDVMAAVESVLQPSNRVGAILLECSAFCPFADDIRKLSTLAVADFHTAADLIMTVARGRVSPAPGAP